MIPTLSSTKSIIVNSLESQPKAIRRTPTYFTTTTTKNVNSIEPIKLVQKYTKPEGRKSTKQRKLTMPKICGSNDFVKIKRAQSRFLDMVARDKSNRISGFDASRFAHKMTALCALSVKRNVPTLKSRTLLPCRKLQVSTDSQST